MCLCVGTFYSTQAVLYFVHLSTTYVSFYHCTLLELPILMKSLENKISVIIKLVLVIESVFVHMHVYYILRSLITL